MKVTPFECYKTYVAMKQHFTKDKYDYFKYGGNLELLLLHLRVERIDIFLRE